MKFSNKLAELAEKFGFEGNHVPYTFAAEHLDDKGQIDYAYFTRKYKVYGSVKDFKSAVIEVFGTTKFTFDEPTDSITKAEFLKHYEFGKFPRVIDWVSHLAKTTGKLLRKEDLFEWVLSTSAPSKANYDMKEINRVD